MAIQGTITLTGPIAPTSTGDTYPVFDTTYGLDGLRNVNTLTDRNNIPNDRRRAGMLVGVSGTSGTEYYTLLKEPWTGTDSDWIELNTGGNSVSGFTFNPSNYDISIGIKDSTGFTQNLSILATDVTITSGSYNPTNGVVTFSANTTNSLSGLNYRGNWSSLSAYTTNDAVTYAVNGLNYFTLTSAVGPSPTPPTGDTANWIPLSQRNVFNVSGFTTGSTDTNIYNSDGTLSGGNRTVQLSAYTLEFKSGNTSVLFMSGGNVNIGTTTDAGYRLDVSGTTRVSGAITAIANGHRFGNFQMLTSGNAGATGQGITVSGTDATVQIQGSSNNKAIDMFQFRSCSGSEIAAAIDNASKSVIRVYGGFKDGNLPNLSGNQLWLSPNYYFTGATGTIVRGVYYSPVISGLTGTTHRAWENTTGDIYMCSTSGNTGIGTPPNASYKLDVNGTIRVQNSSFTGTNLTIANTGSNTQVITGGPSSENITFGPSNRIFLNAGQVSLGSSYLTNVGTLETINKAGSAGDAMLIQHQGSLLGGAGITQNFVRIFLTVAQQLASPVANILHINPIYNNTGTTGTAIIRGIYYNPEISALTATTHNAWENTTGNMYMCSTGGSVGIGTVPNATYKLDVSGGTTRLNDVKIDTGVTNLLKDFWGTTGVGFAVVGRTFTDQTTSGNSVGDLAINSFGRPTISAKTGGTYAGLSTVYIENAPDTSGSASITGNTYALKVASGNTYFGGGLFVPAIADTGFAGKATLPGSGVNSILVNNPNASVNSLIYVSHQTSSGILGHLYVETLVTGSFYIRSSSLTDSSDVTYIIINKNT
jgi:hypothetical protein